MAYIPYDTVFEILSYLPSKPLHRFRSVSKQFNSIITDPCFLRLHYRRSQAFLFSFNGVTMNRGRDNVDLTIFLTDEYIHLIHESTRRFHNNVCRIFGSNHQFLCFVLDDTISLYDPVNLDFLELPKSPSSRVSSPPRVSFGFIESTMQYKVVRWFLPYRPNIVYEVLTLSITRDCRLVISPWRLSQKHCPYIYLLDHSIPPVHAEGYVYWATLDYRIISFSLEEEAFSVLPQPPCFGTKNQTLDGQENAHAFSIYGIRGKLWVIDYDIVESVMDIWTRTDEKSSKWIKIHRVELKGTLGFCRRKLRYSCFPFEIYDVTKDLVSFRLLHPNVIKLYKAKENITHDIQELIGELQFCHYIDGLLSFNNVVYE